MREEPVFSYYGTQLPARQRHVLLSERAPAGWLERLLQLLGADVRRWYLDMPRSTRDSGTLAMLSDI
jgi:hypothetical protein